MTKKLMVLFSFLLLNAAIMAQALSIPFTVSDGTSDGKAVLHFGIAPTATDGLDTGLDEQALPPLPPSGVFDARFVLPSPSTDASMKDFRTGATPFTGSKTYKMSFQVGAGTGITLSWNLPAGVTAVLQDLFGGVIVNVNVPVGPGTYVVSNAAITSLNLIVTYTGAAATGISDNMKSATKFELAQNYPNPFNPSTMIAFSLPSESRVTLEVFNTLGQKITTLVNNETKVAGAYETSFSGAGLNSGLYFARIEAKSANKTYVQVRKMVLMK